MASNSQLKSYGHDVDTVLRKTYTVMYFVILSCSRPIHMPGKNRYASILELIPPSSVPYLVSTQPGPIEESFLFVVLITRQL
jgi:hypothetical protein